MKRNKLFIGSRASKLALIYANKVKNEISKHYNKEIIIKEINNTIKISGELSYLTYLAKQAGGLSDYMFESNPLQSNRSRNY